MIPEQITRSAVLEVISELNEGKLFVPLKQCSTKYCLVYEGRHYPPKYLIRIANLKIRGEELWAFYGGKETNDFCRSRGFEVVGHGGAPH